MQLALKINIKDIFREGLEIVPQDSEAELSVLLQISRNKLMKLPKKTLWSLLKKLVFRMLKVKIQNVFNVECCIFQHHTWMEIQLQHMKRAGCTLVCVSV